MTPSTHKRDLYLIDASVYIFRAYFSLPPELADRDNNPTNAVYGFCGFLCTLLDQLAPSHIGVAFDESLESSFRNQLYPAYKANREPAPIDLKRQFTHCRAAAEALGIECVSSDQYEADDLIGTLAARKRHHGLRAHIVSSDKDLAQLIEPDETLWDFARNQRLDYAALTKKFGVRPEQMADYLALTGDAVDNIPGVPGIGPKSAAALIGHFGDLETLLQRAAEVPYLSIRGAKSLHRKLVAHREDARLARRLTTIALDAPIAEPEPSLEWRRPDLATLNDLFDYLNFGPLLRQRCAKIAQRHPG